MFSQCGLQNYLLVWEPDLWRHRAGQWCDGGHVGAASSSRSLLAALEVCGLVAVGGAVAVVVRDALLLVHRGVRQLLYVCHFLVITSSSHPKI